MTMKNMGKRVLSLLLSLTMLLTLLPVPALAADNGDFRGEELDTAEVYNWLVENYVDADEETGAIFVPAGQLGLYLAFPDAPGNEGRKVDMFTLWTEIDGGYAALQLRPDEFMDSLEDEDAAMVAIYETGEAYLMMGTPDIILEEDPLAVPEEIPVLPEENPVIPEETPALPEETPEAPEETPALPEETPETPEETPETPEETPETPEETPETPEETPETPEETPEAPEETPDVSDETTDVSDETEDVSDETADVSDETEEDSDETADVSDETADVSDETSDVSDETEEDSGEEVMTSLQNASGKLPVSLWVRYGGKGYTDALKDILESMYGPSTLDLHDEYVVTFEFEDADGDRIDGSKQILKADQAIQCPAAPVKANNKDGSFNVFDGWTITVDGETRTIETGDTFADLVTEEGAEYVVTPNYKAYWHVTFMSGDNKTPCYIAEVPCGEALTDEQFQAAKEAYVPTEAGNTVSGWYYDHPVEDGVPVANTIATAAGETPDIMVTFDSQGGTGVNAVHPDKDGKVDLTGIEPTQIGCVFTGWAYDAEGTQMCESIINVAESVILYAQWERENRTYTVRYWLENADNDEYSFVYSEPADAVAIGTKLAGEISKSWTVPSKVANANQFTYSEDVTSTKNNAELAVAGDGSTVLDLYFTRKTYTLTFKWTKTCQNNSYYHTHNASCYSEDYQEKNVKFDANLADYWKTVQSKTSTTTWRYSIGRNQYDNRVSYYAKMPAGDFTLWHYSDSSKYTWHYYLQALDGKQENASPNPKYHDGSWYYRLTSASANTSNLTYDEEYFNITGFHQKYANESDWWGNPTWVKNENGQGYLYYDRSSFPLKVSNGGTQVKKVADVLYEKPLLEVVSNSNALDLTPPEGKEDYTFAGWALAPNSKPEDKITSKDIMPAKDELTLYAIWTAGENTMTLKDGAADYTLTFEKGQRINTQADLVALVKAKYDTFSAENLAGFQDERGNFIAFPYTVEGNVTLVVARHGEKTTVKYETGAGRPEVNDDTQYVIGVPSLVQVSSDPNFEYWTIESPKPDGVKYYPNMPITIQRGMVLKAHYANVTQTTVTVTYNQNAGEGSKTETTEAKLENDKFTITGLPEGWAREGYKFLGWWTEATAPKGATLYQTGDEVRADSNNSNTLYAIWELVEYPIVYKDGDKILSRAPSKYTVETGSIILPELEDEKAREFLGWKVETADGVTGDILNGTYTIPENTTGKLTFVAQWNPLETEYKVVYKYERDEGNYVVGDPYNEDAPKGGKIIIGELGSSLNLTFSQKVEVSGKHYALDTVIRFDKANEVADRNIVTVNYALDSNEDGTPDKYQATVRYVAEGNGKVNKAAFVEETVTLADLNSDGTRWIPRERTTTALTVTAKADDGYLFTGWTDTSSVAGWEEKVFTNPLNELTLTGLTAGETYTFTANFEEDTYQVTWVYNTEAEDLEETYRANEMVILPSEPTREGFVFKGWWLNADTQYKGGLTAEALGGSNREIVLQAKWELAEAYQVIQHFRGLNGEVITADSGRLTLEAGEVLTDVIKRYEKDYTADDQTVDPEVKLSAKYLYDYTQKKDTAATVGKVTVFDLYYDVDSWKDPTVPNPEKPGDGIADKYQVKVTFTASDGGYVDGETVQVFTDKEADQVTFTPVKVTPKANDGYAFDKWTENGSDVDPFTERAVNGGTEITYLANFDVDENEDGTPDKYQAIVTYKVVNGMIKGTDRDEETVYVTLFDKDNNWAPIPADKLDRQIPERTAKEGFEGGKWDNNPATAILKEKEHDTFTYTFDAKNLTYSVKYFDSSDEKNIVPLEKADGTLYDKVVEVSATNPFVIWYNVQGDHKISPEGYTFDKLANDQPFLKLDDGEDEHVFNVYYAKDKIGTTDPTQPDGTPDKYQVTVQYVSKDPDMGTVSGRTSEVVTIEGKKTSGSALMSGSDAAAESGYYFAKWTAENLPEGNQKEYTSSWLQSAWLDNVKGGETYTFTAEFAENVYTVVFNGNGGTWGNVTSKKFGNQVANATVTAPDAPEWVDASKTFAGWKLGNADFDATRTVSELWEQAGKPKNCTIEVTADWETVQLNYSVVQKFRDESAKIIFTSKPVYGGSADYGTSYADLVKAEYKGIATYKEVAYLYDETSIQDRKLTEDGAQIELYYDVDSWNKDGPSETGGDGFADKYQVLVQFVSEDDVNKGTVEGKVTQVFGPMADTNADIPVKPDYVTPNAKEGFAFDVWKKDGSIVNPFTFRNEKGGTKLTYTACFGTDEKGPNGTSDKIPDKYQAEVTYQVINGKWSDGTTTEKKALVTLKTRNDVTMAWVDIPATQQQRGVPSGMKAETGFKAPTSWKKGDVNVDPATVELAPLYSENVFTWTFVKDSFGYTVEYYFDGVKDDILTDRTRFAEFDSEVVLTPAVTMKHGTPEQNYVLDSENHKIDHISATESENVIKVEYATDEIGIIDPTEPDGTADKYQVTVNYKAGQNGSLEGGNKTVVLTIPGEKVTTGTVTLNAPAPKANEFYHFVNWTKDNAVTEPTTLEVTGGQTYTFTANFAENVYTVIFDANGGSIGSESKVEKEVPASRTLGALVGEVGNPENAGSNFLGWQFTDTNKQVQDYSPIIYGNVNAGKFWKATNNNPEDLTITFTAKWEVRSLNYSYTQHFLDAKGNEALPSNFGNGYLPYGTKSVRDLVGGMMKEQPKDGMKYLYTEIKVDNAAPTEGSIDAKITKDNIHIDLYYVVDKWNQNGPSETGGDNIPDNQQALVKFVSENVLKGTVSGTTVRVYTLKQNTETVNLPTDITAEGKTNFAFDHWTQGSEKMGKIPATMSVEQGEEYTYMAYFDKDVIGPEGKPDGIPDQYQATVIFKIENGYWGMVKDSNSSTGYSADKADKTHIVSFKVLDSDGVLVDANPVKYPTVPTGMRADLGYGDGSWDKTPAQEKVNAVKVEETLTLTYSYKEQEKTYQVKYFVYGPGDVSLGNGDYDKTFTTDADSVDWDDAWKLDNIDGYVFNYVNRKTLSLGLIAQNNVFKVYYAKDAIGTTDPTKPDGIADMYQVTVNFEAGENGSIEGTQTKVLTIDPENSTSGSVSLEGITAEPKANEKFAFDYWTLTSDHSWFADNGKTMTTLPTSIAGVEGGKTYTFTANFDKDEVKDPIKTDPENPDPEKPGDGTPDKAQAVLVYRIENGTWSDGSTEIRVNVTLKEQNEDGSWTPVDPEPDRQIPNGTPNGGYRVIGWDIDPVEVDPLTVATEGENVFTYRCVPLDTRILTIRYMDEDGTEIQASTRRTLVEGTLPILVNASSISGYVAIGETSRVITALADQTITFTYARDVLSDPNRDGNGSEPGDGIPDSMQYEVTYTATNGTVSIASTVVTKLDGNGEPSADGIARLAANQVATATRVSTVYSAIPTWTPRVPVADLVITENTAFNANFTTAGGGGGGTGGGGGGTTIPDVTVPLADEAVPLAGDVMLNLDDHFAYIKGYADGTVRPNNFITRAQVATIFYRLMTAESRAIYFAESNDYSDVASDFWANKAISTLSNAEIITGFSDGTFRPNAYITRAQFAAIAARFDSVVPGLENPFSDVSEEHWAHDLIAYAASKGWIGGYDDGTFRPNNNITRAAAMNLINNVLQRHVDEEGLLEDATQWSDNKPGDWHYYVVLEATNSHDYDRREEGELMENWTALTPDPEWDE